MRVRMFGRLVLLLVLVLGLPAKPNAVAANCCDDTQLFCELQCEAIGMHCSDAVCYSYIENCVCVDSGFVCEGWYDWTCSA